MVDKSDLATVTVLKERMSNFEVWNFRIELAKRDCIDVIKYKMDENDKIAMIAKKYSNDDEKKPWTSNYCK